jgi:hypothetical protein
MNELKREIEEALAKAAVRPDGIIIKEESKYFPLHWYFEKGNEELRDNCLYWLRQLLDENQRQEVECELLTAQKMHLIDENQDLMRRLVRLSKVLSPSASELQALRDENQALHKERDFYKEDRDRCERLERKAYEQLEAQAKEIELLKQRLLLPEGVYLGYENLNAELQALREREVRYREALEWYEHPKWDDKGERARNALIGNQEEGMRG